MNPSLLDALGRIVGPRWVRHRRAELTTYTMDGLPTHESFPGAVVVPGSRREVIEIVRLLHVLGVPFVARGAGTGLSGGALADTDAVLIALTRLNRILQVDPRSRRALWEMIRDLRASGVTVFLTTQYLEEADQLADVIAVMDGGKIIAEGTADQLKRCVGQERLELAFAHQHALETARRVLGGQVRQPAAQSSILSVAIDGGPRQIKAVLDQMQQAAIEVDSVALRKPTLDDVFLTLIGRHAGTAPGAGGRHDD